MIDLSTEALLSFPEACKRLPRRRSGKRPHPATLYRWASDGLRGVMLETIQVGGTLCTSMEALQRFFSRLGSQSARSGRPPCPCCHRARMGADAGPVSYTGSSNRQSSEESGDAP